MRSFRGSKLARTHRARDLRQDSTIVERRLWQMLRGRQVEGLKFVRQYPIGPYFADFACREIHLVVELDGGQHADNAHDARRDAFMRSHRYMVLRFWNTDIVENIEGVIQRIGTVARSKMAEDKQTGSHRRIAI